MKRTWSIARIVPIAYCSPECFTRSRTVRYGTRLRGKLFPVKLCRFARFAARLAPWQLVVIFAITALLLLAILAVLILAFLR